MPSPALSVRDLCVSLPTEAGYLDIVRHVSLDVMPGEFAAIVGESGCGKSITAMALALLPPTDRAAVSGQVLLDGRDLLTLPPEELRGVRGRGIAYVFQDPSSSLNPVLSVRTQLREALPPDMPRKEADRRLAELLETVRIHEPERILRSYPHELSGGLQQRVMVAMAAAASPRVLVADEPTTALDVTTQQSVLELLDNLRRERGIALVLITHNLGLVARHADRVHVMYAGEIVESGAVPDVLGHPSHPYTAGLIGAVPSLDMKGPGDLRGIPGRVPMPSEWGEGCAFAPRCARAVPECRLPRRRTCLRPLRAGFSLLELMAVLLILAMLAGLVIGQARLARVRGEEARVRIDLGHVATALERYRESMGHYPSSADAKSDGSGDGSCIVTNLNAWDSAPVWMMDGVENADDVHCLKNFFPEANEVQEDGDEPFSGLDPWSRPYRYFHDPETAPDTYRVFSLGPNDPDGTHPDRWIFLER